MLICPVKTDLPVVEAPLAFELAHRAAIDAYWQDQLVGNDRLWNGPSFLFENAQCENGVLRATAHKTDFATFLYWRFENRDVSLVQIAGSSLVQTTDGALVAMEMAAHTVNAGRIYFPAGAFDPEDMIDGRLDAETNIRRELAEETGLALSSYGDAIAVYEDDAWHIAIPSYVPMTFSECEAQVAAHQAATGDDELARLVPIRTKADAQSMVPFARILAEFLLDG